MLKTIYTENSSLKNSFTGIGKTVSFLFSTIVSLGYNMMVLETKQNSFIKDLFYYNFTLRKYCKKHLTEENPFLIPNNMGKFFRLPHSNTWIIVHDLIPLSNRFGYKGIKRLLYKIKMSQLKKASRIFTISEYVKKDIIDNIGVPAEKIDVIYWPNIYSIDNIKTKKGCQIQFLGVGTGEARKDIQEIINYWRFTPEDYQLFLFGKEIKSGEHDKIKNLISSLGLSERVKILGKVTDEELSDLYSRSSGFIFSSKEEGFGLPPLEALSHGTPVILPKTPINFELYGDIGHFYSAGDISEFLAAIHGALICGESEEKYKKFLTTFSVDNFRKRLKYLIDEKKDSN